MNGLDAYRIYKSVFLHFNDPRWNPDSIKTGKFFVKCKPETYIMRKDHNIFDYIATKFSQKEWFRFVIANAMYGYSDCVYNLEVGRHNTNVWEGNRLRLNYLYELDVSNLQRYLHKDRLKDSLLLVKFLSQGRISIETVSAINTFVKITDMIRNSNNYSPIIEPLLLRIDRSSPFVKIPEPSIDILKSVII